MKVWPCRDQTDRAIFDRAQLPAEQFAEYNQFMRRLAIALLGREEGADDLVQETWIVAMRRPPGPDRPLRAWLIRVLRSLTYKSWREGSRRLRRESRAAQEPRPELPTPEALLDRRETQKVLRRILTDLPEPYRSTLLLRRTFRILRKIGRAHV